jgi:polysaccharide deacetylase 2 family uncharacterized protein YibQ
MVFDRQTDDDDDDVGEVSPSEESPSEPQSDEGPAEDDRQAAPEGEGDSPASEDAGDEAGEDIEDTDFGDDDDDDAGEASPSEEPLSEPQSDEGPAEDDRQAAPEGEGDSPTSDDAGDEAGEDIEDTDFGDDDDDDDDEEGGGKSKKKLIIIGGGATAALLLIGGVTWYFMSGDSGDKNASEEVSNIPKVTIDIAPKAKPKGGGLNAILAGTPGAGVAPGAGVMVPVISPMAFASLAPPKVMDGPLGASNDPALSEESPQGPLPITAEDGRQSWQVYAKPFENQNSNPRVAIVVRGLGQSETATDAAIHLLPGNVTLAFDPYAPKLLDWMEKARAAGHEVMVMVPLESTTFPLDDPGPLGLMTINAPEENRLRLENILSRMTGYIGVVTVMGSKFNTSDEHLRIFLGEIRKRGLMFLEGTINSDSLASKIATEIGLPRAVTNIVLDSIPTKAEIDAQLVELEAVLAGQPAAVAIAEGYPSSIERIAAWTSDLEAKKLVLAPLSALADKQLLE